MNLYEAIKFFQELHPDKKITVEFDAKCHRILELTYTNGLPNAIHHIENDKVKINTDDSSFTYVPIHPHRLTVAWADLKKFIVDSEDVHLNDDQLNEINEDNVNEVSKLTGLTNEQLMAKKK